MTHHTKIAQYGHTHHHQTMLQPRKIVRTKRGQNPNTVLQKRANRTQRPALQPAQTTRKRGQNPDTLQQMQAHRTQRPALQQARTARCVQHKRTRDRPQTTPEKSTSAKYQEIKIFRMTTTKCEKFRNVRTQKISSIISGHQRSPIRTIQRVS